MYDYSITYYMSNKYIISYLYSIFTKTFTREKWESGLFLCQIITSNPLQGHLPNIFFFNMVILPIHLF